MRSIDTNVLLYALVPGRPEHQRARDYLTALEGDDDIAIAELVLVELYLLLRNPRVCARPLTAEAAAGACQSLRRHPRWRLVGEAPVMDEVWRWAARSDLARRRIIDVRLALTLRHHGVVELITRNVKDFEGLGFERVTNPFD